MNCSEAERLLNALLDGDIDSSPRLDAHVAKCESCRELRDALLATVGDLEGLPLPEPSRDLTAAVMAAIDEENAAREKPLAFSLSLLCFAAAAVCLIAALWRGGWYDSAATVVVSILGSAANVIGALVETYDLRSPGCFVMAWLLGGGATAVALILTASLARLANRVPAAGRRSVQP